MAAAAGADFAGGVGADVAASAVCVDFAAVAVFLARVVALARVFRERGAGAGARVFVDVADCAEEVEVAMSPV